MEKPLLNLKTFIVILLLLFAQTQTAQAQCTNSDFEDGTLNGWNGTYGNGICTGTLTGGNCSGCYTPDPYQHNTLNQGPNNQPANGNAGFNHFIMTSGFDPIAGGTNLPVIYSPGSYSVRLGDAHANDAGHGGGESINYRFIVTQSNCNFIYHYAVVLKDGGHVTGQQPYFKIGMVDDNNNTIDCATFDVDATTAQTIGGFVTVGSISYKTWSTVSIPLNNYIGQTVSITFTTRDCAPNGCEGSHWAYAYIDADCGPLLITSSSPSICNGQTVTLTAPDGAATYAWSGPGIISGANAQQCVVNMAGNYMVNMTTIASVPCNFSLTTTLSVSPTSLVANFSTGSLCAGSPTSFTDISTPVNTATTWAWDFNNDGNTDATTQNPTHTFAAPGTYPVHLLIGSPPCIDDTTINVVIAALPTSSFTATISVCAGASGTITYTGTAPSNTTYTWNFAGGTIVSGTGQGPYQVSWATGGVKNVMLTVTSNGCSSAVTTVPVTVNALPVVTASPNMAICAGVSTTITAFGANTYSWTPSSGLSGVTGASVTAAPSATTTYAVTGTSSGCADSASVTVTVNPVPVVTVSPDISICAGSNATLTAAGATTYSWTPSAGLSSTTGASIIAAPSATTTYSATGNSLGCINSASVTVTVKPVPTATFTTTSPVCAGTNAAITYTGTAPANAAYTWNFAGGTITSGTGQGPYLVNWSTAGTKNITLTVTSTGCLSPVITVPVTVNAIPVVIVTPDLAICPGESAALTAAGATTYSWALPQSLSSATGAAVTATPVSTTTYAVTGTSLGCSDSASVTVTIKSVPVSSFTATSPVCAGANAAITYTGNALPNDIYSWNFAGGTVVSGTGAGPYQIKWFTGGIKNVTLMVVSNGCASAVTTVPVTVNAIPVVMVSPDVAICIGESTTLTASGATTYTWSPVVGLSGNAGASIIAIPAATTTYAVTGTTLGCSDSASVTVSTKPIPTSLFATTSPVCAGANAAITYTGNALPNATYSWSFSGGTVMSGSGAGPYQVNWSTAGIKNVTLSVISIGCPSPVTTVPVTVNAIPTVEVSQDAAICAGESTALIATGAATYNWTPATALSANTGASVTATPAATTTYTVTGATAGCQASASVTVNVTPVPMAGFSPIAGQCLSNNNFNFQATGIYLPAATFAWNFGTNATPAMSSSQNQQVTFSSTGSNTVSLIITQNGCVSNTYTDVVNVYPMPVVNFSADTLIGCQNLPVCFTDYSTGAGPLLYQWNFGDGQTSTSSNPCHTYANAGSYNVNLQVISSEGCKDDSVVQDMVHIIANPLADFTLSSTIIQLPATTVEIQNLSQNALSYLWLLGNSATTTVQNPGVTSFTTPGYYPITLYAYNELGCVDSVQHAVTVYQEEVLFVPNVFTPNGDGNNDFFEIFGKKDGWKQIEVLVFDRWGEKVFESNDMNFKWDGIYKGEKMMGGVYVYLLRIVYTNNHSDKIHKGSLTLVR